MIKRPTYDDYDEYIIDYDTSNPSFLKMASLLRRKGIKNYNFFLKLYDEDLVGVDPYDPNLSTKMKGKIFVECRKNFWYFIREVMSVPGVGRYSMHRGNLALSWCCINNIPVIEILPRQFGKTWAVVAYALWVFNFGSDHCNMLFLNKQLSDAQENLKRLRSAREELPEYLRMDKVVASSGSLRDAQANVNSMNNALQNNIVVKPSANSPTTADQLGRGLSFAWVWIDEFAFLQFNRIIYAAMSPAYKKSADVALSKGKPIGKIFTTTPSDLSTDQGAYAHEVIDNSARFTEDLYDMDSDDVSTWLSKNSNYGYIFIQFSYTQLQLADPEKWFADACKEEHYDWPKIRREYLLQWSNASTNSPFDEEDLRELHGMIKDPLENSITINKFYKLNVYKKLEPTKKYIISVDPAKGRGEKADRTAIVVIDAETDEPCAIFKSPVIQYRETFRFLYTLFYQYIPNSVIVVENNIDTLIEYIRSSTMKHALYYEVSKTVTKDKLNKPVHTSTPDNIIYGLTTTRDNRPKYFDILFEMVRKEKELLRPRELMEEIETLEYKSETRIEAVSGMHDDVIMAFLMGIYVKRCGRNRQRFGLFYSDGIAQAVRQTPSSYFDSHSNFGNGIDESSLNPFWAELVHETKSAIDADEINETDAKYSTMVKANATKDSKIEWMSDVFSQSTKDSGISMMDGDAFVRLNARETMGGSLDDVFGGDEDNTGFDGWA